MSSFDVRKLQDLYNSFSQAEYQRLLLKVVSDLRGRLNLLPLRYHIIHRVKDFRSYFNKIVSQSPQDVTPISDLLGIRIVCPFLEDLFSHKPGGSKASMTAGGPRCRSRIASRLRTARSLRLGTHQLRFQVVQTRHLAIEQQRLCAGSESRSIDTGQRRGG